MPDEFIPIGRRPVWVPLGWEVLEGSRAMQDPLERALRRLWSETAFPEAKWAVLRPGERLAAVLPSDLSKPKWVYTDKEVRIDQSGVLYLESEEQVPGQAGERWIQHLWLPPGTWLGAVRL